MPLCILRHCQRSISQVRPEARAGLASKPRITVVPGSALDSGSTMMAAAQGKGVKITTRSKSVIQYGDELLELAAVEQLVEASQTRAVSDAVRMVHRAVGQGQQGAGGATLMQLLKALELQIDAKVRRS